MKVRARIGCLLAATSLFAVGTLTAVAPAANAETLSFEYLHKGAGTTTEQWLIVAYHNGDYAGEVIWNKDPWDWNPGDAFKVTDDLADGWGLTATLDTGRTASTVGHSSPYDTGWVKGNLAEGSKHTMNLTFWKGGSFSSSDYVTVSA